MTTRGANVYFIHNAISSFYESMKIFFLTSFYPRYRYGVVTTYDKNLQTIIQSKETDNLQHFSPPTPSFAIDPNIDMNPMDKFNDLWRYRNFSGGFSSLLFDPIYKDDDVVITPAYNRYEGTFDVKSFVSSVYEAIDLKRKFDQFFGKTGRVFRPIFTRSYLHIPISVINFIYENDVLDIRRPLNWATTDVKYQMYKSINSEEFFVPLTLKPWISMESNSTSVDKFTDNSSYPNYEVNTSFKLEINLPTDLYITTDYKIDDVQCNLFVGGDYFPSDVSDLIQHHCDEMTCETGVYSHIENYMTSVNPNVTDIPLNINIRPFEKIIIYRYGKRLFENIDYEMVGNNSIKLLTPSQIHSYLLIQLWRKDGY